MPIPSPGTPRSLLDSSIFGLRYCSRRLFLPPKIRHRSLFVEHHHSILFPRLTLSALLRPQSGAVRRTMAPRQKFVKKFYRRLAISQIEDTFLSPAGVLEIKLNLKHYSQCAQLTLQNDTKHAFVSHISLQPLPNFFRSQIEGQRLSTDPLRITVQVATVLAFVDGFLTTKPKGERSRPTLFTWHLPDNPRTYCLFAYLTHNMVSRTYSVTELLELRGSQSCRTLLNKVRMNPDLGE